MESKLLISDANILIDLEVGKLIDAMFQLPYEYAVPDLLFEQELNYQRDYLLDKGLQLLELQDKAISRMLELGQYYKGVSHIDLSALALAEQEHVSLLTGDRKLRQVCDRVNIEVHGTVWIIGKMLECEVITVTDAENSYNGMEEAGSFLPWDEVKDQLKRYKKENG
ncbi:MAG: PIN domain-containing protein [Gammaproteobacteria bacterium]